MLKIRVARSDDSKDLLSWRNDKLSRNMFKNGEVITLKDHKVWFESVLGSPFVDLYIGESNCEKIGVCRFDYSPELNSAEVSINLNPLMRGKGFSYCLLTESIKEYSKKHAVMFKATVKRENVPSRKIFEKCGFVLESEDEKYLFLKLQ